MLERVREEGQRGLTFDKAVQRVRANTVFTTHTPVPAGHDIFPAQLVRSQLDNLRESLGIDWETFLNLGREDSTGDDVFNMTALGLKMADQRNAVSALHKKVTRKMWHGLWPEVTEDEVPISHVTNGIHVPTWIAPELSQLFDKYLGHDWVKRHDSAELWQHVLDIPDDELWEVRQLLRRKLIHTVQERAQARWAEGELTLEQVMAMGALLDHDMLTIGFARRFTEYKRPELIFYDVERLKRIVKDRWRPVQIVFAGKSDPSDFPAKHLVNKVFALAKDSDFQGRIAFVENYDMHMAHYLVQGTDVWLNNPRRLLEACGTSGMKAALNGVLHLSVRDGWWYEGYNGANGWVIGDDVAAADPEEENRADAEALYRLLEEEIVPLYYDRDRNGVPHGWISMMKESISSIAPRFSARRMLREYTERMYIPVAESLREKTPQRHWLVKFPFLSKIRRR
jgi:starch phosphorylase